MNELGVLDYAGVAVFAATGALAASRKRLDVVGFLFFAIVTGVGGGTVRDLVLGVPVFWVEDQTFIGVCAAVAGVVFLAAHRIESRYRLLLWLDAAGVSAYSVYGAWKGTALSASPVVAIVTGVLTATLGGILRDILAAEPSVLMKREIYVSAAVAGATVFVALVSMGLAPLMAGAAGCFIAFALRAGAIHYGWSIPSYLPRPGRRSDEG